MKSIIALALLSTSAFALNCGPNLLTFQDSSAAALSSDGGNKSNDNTSSNNGGIICVLVTNGSAPRFAFYGEGRVGQSQYRFLGHAFANPSGSASGNLGQTQSTSSSSTTSQSQPSVSLTQPMVSLGGYQVEPQLSGSFAGTTFNTGKQRLTDIYDQVTFNVSSDKIIISNGKVTRTWVLKTDIPNYQPLPLPDACGAHLDAFRVRYPEGVKVPNPAVGLRCAMPHKTGLLMTYMGVGRMSNVPYMYIATRGNGGQWGRVGICWHNPQLLAAGKCLKSDFGSFIVKAVDAHAGQLDINAEVQNGLRELWIPKALNAKKSSKSGGLTLGGSGAKYQVNQQEGNLSGSTYQGQGSATSQDIGNLSGSTYQGDASSSSGQGSSSSSSSSSSSGGSQESTSQSSDSSSSYQDDEYFEEEDFSQSQSSSSSSGSSSSSDAYQYDSSSNQ